MIYINNASKMPIYQQIYEQLKKEIITNNLKEGNRLTSTRVLANNLCVARNTVENAYSQLCLEGYVLNKPGSGFIVQNINDDFLSYPNISFNKSLTSVPLHQKNADHPLLSSAQELLSSTHDESAVYRYNFQYGNLDNAAFPSSLWRHFTGEALLSIDAQKINLYCDKQGELDLRIEIMKYVEKSRGVSCTPDQIVLCCGTQYALDLVCKFFPADSRKLAIEEPCYDGARTVFENNGFEIIPIPIKSDGISISDLERSSARVTYITPSHQFPTGVAMPIQNRINLLYWATQNDCIIVEDDYNSEFRYNARPIPALQSIDNNGRVIYLGTFSKVLSSGLRMSYMILPTWLLPKYQRIFAGYYSAVPWLMQRIVRLYMAGGHWERQIRKICFSYKKKHDVLVNTITQLMGDKVIIHGKNAGSHILLEFVNGEKQKCLIEKAREYKVKVYSTSPFWYIKENCAENTILIGYSNLSEQEIVEGITLLNKAWFGHY